MSGTNERGLLLDEERELGVEELCEMCGVRRELIAEMVDHAILQPARPADTTWRFSAVSVTRISRAVRLRRDLELNWPAVALTLDLLDELQELRRRHAALLLRHG